MGGSVISAGTMHDLRRVKVPGTGPLWNPCILAKFFSYVMTRTNYIVCNIRHWLYFIYKQIIWNICTVRDHKKHDKYDLEPILFSICKPWFADKYGFDIEYTVDSRYLEFDGTMEKIRVNRSSTQEELRRYRKCGLFNNERETTRA